MASPEIQAAIDAAVATQVQALIANADAKIKELEQNHKNEIERLKGILASQQ